MLTVIKLADSSTNNESEVNDNTVTKVGAKYVAGDITLSIGSHLVQVKKQRNLVLLVLLKMQKTTRAGISYAVASGVTANIGWKDVDSQNDGSSETSGGTSWYIGANMSF